MGIPAEDGDCIHIEELELMVRVGVPDEEREQAQRLTASITMWPSTRFDLLRDQLANTVDYAVVCKRMKTFASGPAHKLIESLAAGIATDLLATFPIARVRVELRKFILPDVRHVAVILTRERPVDS